MMINVGIIGATGHTGEELISVLLNHPYVRLSRLYNTSEEEQKISDAFPQFKGRIELTCSKPDMKDIAALIRKVLVDKKDPQKVARESKSFMQCFKKLHYSFDKGKDPYKYFGFEKN